MPDSTQNSLAVVQRLPLDVPQGCTVAVPLVLIERSTRQSLYPITNYNTHATLLPRTLLIHAQSSRDRQHEALPSRYRTHQVVFQSSARTSSIQGEPSVGRSKAAAAATAARAAQPRRGLCSRTTPTAHAAAMLNGELKARASKLEREIKVRCFAGGWLQLVSSPAHARLNACMDAHTPTPCMHPPHFWPAPPQERSEAERRRREKERILAERQAARERAREEEHRERRLAVMAAEEAVRRVAPVARSLHS